MQTVSFGDSLHEMSKPIFWKKKKKNNISKCCLLNFLPSVLSIKGTIHMVHFLSTFVTSCLLSSIPSPFEKGSTLKGKNLLPLGANYWVYCKRKEFAPIKSKFFPFREDPFSEVGRINLCYALLLIMRLIAVKFRENQTNYRVASPESVSSQFSWNSLLYQQSGVSVQRIIQTMNHIHPKYIGGQASANNVDQDQIPQNTASVYTVYH